MDEDKPIDLTKEVDREETFEMFIQYIYTCKYQVPSHFDTADICRLHARVYVLADQFLMDVLKRFALTKMTSMLKEDDEWSSSVNLSPEVIQQLVEIVYDGTKDKQRWFDAIGETATNPLESTDMGSGQGSVALKENEDHVGPNPANTNDINKGMEVS